MDQEGELVVDQEGVLAPASVDQEGELVVDQEGELVVDQEGVLAPAPAPAPAVASQVASVASRRAFFERPSPAASVAQEGDVLTADREDVTSRRAFFERLRDRVPAAMGRLWRDRSGGGAGAEAGGGRPSSLPPRPNNNDTQMNDADGQEDRDFQEAIRRSQLDSFNVIANASASASASASTPPVTHMNDIDIARPVPSAQTAQQPTSIPSLSSSSSSPSSVAAVALVEGANESSPSLCAVTESSPGLCAVCMDQPKTMAFHPCGHMCLCAGTRPGISTLTFNTPSISPLLYIFCIYAMIYDMTIW